MNKNKLLKITLVIVMGIVLIAMSANVFAATVTDDDFLNINITNNSTTNTNTNTNTNINTNINTNLNTSTNTNNYNTSLPKAGIADNTILGISITVLGIVSVFAYKKIREYKNI